VASPERGGSAAAQAVERGITREAVDGLTALLAESELDRRARLKAFAIFERLPSPPSRLSRAAKRNLAAVDLARAIPYLDLAQDGEPATVGAHGEEPAESASLVVLVDGRAVTVRLAPEIAASGAYVAPFETALRERPELVRAHSGRLVPDDSDRFTALNAALRRGGLVVHVPAGVTLNEPIELRTVIERASVFPRVLVVAEDGASVQVIERIESRPLQGDAVPARLVCSVGEIVVGRGASVRYAALQHLDEDVAEVSVRRASVGRDATMVLAPVVLGGGIVREDADVVLEGEGSSTRVRGCFFASGEQAFDLAGRVTHAAPHTSADAVFHGAASGAGQASLSGMISIRECAAGSESSLKNRALLLSPKAHIDSVPGLEIANNDVKAYHGATIGEIDEETLFYCQSRGIPRDAARRMIILGFLSPVVDAIASPGARAWLERCIEAKL